MTIYSISILTSFSNCTKLVCEHRRLCGICGFSIILHSWIFLWQQRRTCCIAVFLPSVSFPSVGSFLVLAATKTWLREVWNLLVEVSGEPRFLESGPHGCIKVTNSKFLLGRSTQSLKRGFVLLAFSKYW